MRIFLVLLSVFALQGAPLYQASFDSNAKWQAIHGAATPDSAVEHDKHASLRVEPAGESDALIHSTPVNLTIGKSYQLSAWVRTENLEVRDLDRTPIATGASIAMASMPFDVHSESLGGTRPWTRLNVRFTATRSQDQVLLAVAEGGSFRGKAWFEGVSIEEVAGSVDLPQSASLRTFGAGYRYPKAGWIYVHIEGEPYDRGYQHGYLLAREIEQYIDRCAAELDPKSKEQAWRNGRTTANALFLRGFDQEILQEMKGIADGAAKAGAKYDGHPVDLIDIVTLNTITELGELNAAMPVTPTGLEGFGMRPPRPARSTGGEQQNDHCSAFAACGKATKNGRMVIGHVTWWPLTLAEQTNIMLDVQPVTGHRVLMQSYPGGIQSGTDWYQNDLGVVLTETTIDQSPFNIQGTSVAYRARKSIQYGDSIDKVVELLKTRNNGLYTNEWIIGDARTNEIAMFELGTYKTKLYRSSKNEWFGNTEGFYWGCNNAKDLDVRLEYVPDPKGEPRDVMFSPTARDIKWQEMYQQHKGTIDESFAFLAFRTAPLVSASTMDAKVTTSEMAPQMMLWGMFGKSNQREWVPPADDEYPGNNGLYSSGYKLFQARSNEAMKPSLAGASAASVIQTSDASESPRGHRNESSAAKDYLWKGWILPATGADTWLSAGSALYYDILKGDNIDNRLNAIRARLRATASRMALSGVQPLTFNADWHTIAETKGALTLDALRRSMGDDAFYALMRGFFDKYTTKIVHTSDFVAAAGPSQKVLLDHWLYTPGLPDAPGPMYAASALRARLGSAILVYGTLAEAGANRYAAEQWQKQFLNQFESQVPIYKDFEVTDHLLASHDVVFIGRPETNQALAIWANRIGLNYVGDVFNITGKNHASENEALIWTATNPESGEHMVLVAAGNSPLSTVLLTREYLGPFQYSIAEAGHSTESGFLK
jgi:hypothetical protein